VVQKHRGAVLGVKKRVHLDQELAHQLGLDAGSLSTDFTVELDLRRHRRH
jgi:hypothetical protein